MANRWETDQVPSPGGWDPPHGVRPGWDWTPPWMGASPTPERMPLWVRLLYRLPFVDRYAHMWMWSHGGFMVFPPDHPWSIHGVPEDDRGAEAG